MKLTRKILIEKAPFWVEILDTPMSNNWWYYEYIGKNLFVQKASFEDMDELNRLCENYGLPMADPQDYYIIMGDTKGGEIFKKGLILKNDCKIIKTK